MSQSHIRNFAIIAHIDHGKSTLADRLLERTGTVSGRDMRQQVLDSNPIERERGITIKLAPVRMSYITHASHLTHKTHEAPYILNLIDTPGHVDFSYEVSRSLAACEGAILVVDASQGVQAQTIANLNQARKHGLTIIPVINKIDLPNARIEETARELEALGFPPITPMSFTLRRGPILISAKTGDGVPELLETIVRRIPQPQGVPGKPLRALVFSSRYDPHKGVIVFVRVVDGNIHQRITNKAEYTNKHLSEDSYIRTDSLFVDKLRFLASGATVTPIEIGYFAPKMIASDVLRCGEVGYIATGLKDIRLAKVGDTITVSSPQSPLPPDLSAETPAEAEASAKGGQSPQSPQSGITPLPGYHEPKPMVFLGLFPIDASEYQSAREATEKLRLNDSAFSFRPISSQSLGHGFHCGFLGLLHAEIVVERLSREFGVAMFATTPSVEYNVRLRTAVIARSPATKQSLKITSPRQPAGSRDDMVIQSASEFPDPSLIEQVREPVMRATIYTPKQYVGPVMQLTQEKRGEYIDLTYHAMDTSSRSEAIGSHGDAIVSQESPARLQHEARDVGLARLTYLIPLSEMIIDYFDRLKAETSGYASLDYEFFEHQSVKIVKVDILVNHEPVDALSFLAVADQAQRRAREIVEKLSAAIPRHQFSIPVQGALGGKIIARTDVKAFRKDVTAKLYGGDRSRKDKLLDKQKKGKAKMKRVGSVEIPQSAFFAVLKQS